MKDMRFCRSSPTDIQISELKNRDREVETHKERDGGRRQREQERGRIRKGRNWAREKSRET